MVYYVDLSLLEQSGSDPPFSFSYLTNVDTRETALSDWRLEPGSPKYQASVYCTTPLLQHCRHKLVSSSMQDRLGG